MVKSCPVIKRSPKDPMRLNGILSMTIREYFGDSNCIAITRNTRNTAAAMASPRDRKESAIISSIVLFATVTDPGSSISAVILLS